MGKEVGSILKKQLLGPLVFDKDTAEKLARGTSSPEYQKCLRELNRLMVESMVMQDYDCPWADLHVQRLANVVTIDWKFRSSAGNPEKYSVTGTVWEIDFDVSPGEIPGGRIASTKGNGSVRLELEEACSYHFQFGILDAERSKAEGTGANAINMISFNVAIPLSDERKKLLRKAVELDLHPEERVRHEFETFLNKQDAFDEMCVLAIERIKAKKLPLEEEENRIADFKEYAIQMKERFGM